MYVFTLLFIFGGIRYVGALRSRLFLSLSAAISQSERYTTYIFPFKPLLFYCRRPSLSLLSLRRSSSSGSSFSGSFSHERTIENSVEGGGEGAVRTLPCLRIHFIHLPLISLSLSFCYIPSPCCPPPGPSPSSLSSGPSSTSPSGFTESFSSPSSPGCSPPRSPAPRPPP